MTSKQVEIYLEVAKTENYTTTAEKLYVSKATISRQMALLEEELGHQLFYHAGNSIKLTAQGEILRKTFEKMYGVFKNGIRLMDDTRDGYQGHLVLGFTSDMSIPDIFLKAIDHFRKKIPDVDITYVSKPFTNYVSDMESGTIDIMLAHDMELFKYKNLAHQFVVEAERGLYYGIRHPLAKKKDLAISDFSGDIHWASKHADTYDQRLLLKQVSDYYGMAEFETKYVDTTNEIIFHLLLGEGFCIMDNIVLQSKPDDILVLPIHADLAPVKKSIYWAKNNVNPCVPLFCDIMERCRKQQAGFGFCRR